LLWIFAARIIRYEEMCALMRPEAENDVMRGLMNCCYLVQGWWVVRSQFLYKPPPAEVAGSRSAAATSRNVQLCRGVPSDVMIRSRDYLLYHFAKSRTVEKAKMRSALRLPAGVLSELLREVGRPVDDNAAVYEFMYPTDFDFMTTYVNF
jgi:hypothetical protein